MTRILHILDGMSTGGGIQSFIMNAYRHIDRNEYQFDFLLHRFNTNSYVDEIERLGGKVYYVAGRKEGYFRNRRELDAFFKQHKEYKIVHFHESSLSYIEPLVIAKNNNIPIRIIHAHSSRLIGKNKIVHTILHRINQLRISNIATVYLACGSVAADWMYGKGSLRNKATILFNGIEIEKYAYSMIIREKVREELHISPLEIVVGHIGRLESVKNHSFLFRILFEILKLNNNTKLIIAGDGTQKEILKEKIKDLKVEDKVTFLGVRNDVQRLMQAMDIMIMPSLYEGFPVTVIEAQATGLPVLLSDSITKEVKVKENIKYLGLSLDPKIWAAEALELIKTERIIDNSKLYEKGLDIQLTVEKLQRIYHC